MDERAFESLVARILADFADRLEQALDDAAEVEFRGGILTVSCADGRQFVVNKHAPTREIWLSSPISGAVHFARRGEEWVSTRGPDRLADRLAQDISAATGVEVVLG
jgi:frataxin